MSQDAWAAAAAGWYGDTTNPDATWSIFLLLDSLPNFHPGLYNFYLFILGTIIVTQNDVRDDWTGLGQNQAQTSKNFSNLA
jgi:hypothetical protein